MHVEIASLPAMISMMQVIERISKCGYSPLDLRR